MRRPPTPPTATADWSRQKMALLLAGGALPVLATVIGLVLAVVSALDVSRHESGSNTRVTVSARGHGHTSSIASRPPDTRDRLAQRPMIRVDDEASHPAPVSTSDPGSLVLPVTRRLGPAGVPSGFPHTPAGALAQLAMIDQSALQSGSLPGARAVIRSWAAAGGPTAESWSVVRGLGIVLDGLGLSGGGSTRLVIVAAPLMGLVKGRVGTDFVIPCVDFELDVTFAQTARGASADCQRMVWQPEAADRVAGGRWVIGAGAEPATPPSVWPDTDTAIAVGYRDVRWEPGR